MINICLYGPESVGKSGMAIQLAQMYQTNYVLEQARNLIDSNNFSEDDIIKIGYAQTNAVLEAVKLANKIVFCDTDVITTQIYSDYYLGKTPEVLFVLEKEIAYDLYILLDIDMPWVADGLRDLGHKRAEMYEIFENELIKRNIDYVKVSGIWSQRVAAIVEIIKLKFEIEPNDNNHI
jgi:HTH-type transcriptional regulator, transcriptional repressor of NAD biosynthesis genes